MHDNKMLSNVTKAYLCRFYDILDIMIKDMTYAELTNSISHNYIVQMIPHHMAAIEMSHNILQYTTFVPLQNVALNIIEEQTKSIENMKQVLDQCCVLQNNPQDLCLYQRNFTQITDTMFTKMKNACTTNNINQNFMREMIPHHQGAIHMSKNLLLFNICPELILIVKTIIKSQSQGVIQMQNLLRCF